MEKRGVRTIKGDFNRAIAADNKLLKEIKARITRLYNWSKELAAREKSLGGRKQSVMAQLMDAQFARQKEKASNSNYAAIRRLKENAAVFNFLMAHNINSIEELFDVISDLNDRYYDLRGKIVNAERRIAALRERLDKLKQYRSYKAVRQKLETLNGKKRALYEEQHKAELATFASAEKYLNALRDAGEKIKPEEWRRETERLNAEREANYKLMEDMREQIKAAENIRKNAERIAEWNQQEEMKRDAPSL